MVPFEDKKGDVGTRTDTEVTRYTRVFVYHRTIAARLPAYETF